MILTYTASVILLSLAMYGIWCVGKDVWTWLVRPRSMRLPSMTILVLVKNLQNDVEEIFRYLAQELESTDRECDAILVDCNSDDLTPYILSRLVEEYPHISVLTGTDKRQMITEILPLCRGTVVHVLDMVNRVSVEEFMATVYTLLQKEDSGLLIKQEH